MNDYGSESFKDRSFTPDWKRPARKPLRTQWWFWVLLIVLSPLLLLAAIMSLLSLLAIVLL